MYRGLLVLLAWVLLGSPAHALEEMTYVTEKDEKTARDADLSVKTYCATAEPIAKEEKKDAKQTLIDAIGGSNFIVESAKASKNSEEFETNLGNSIGEKISGQVGPFFFAAVSLILFVYFICTACPFCKRCRICNGYHPSNLLLKVFFILPIVLVLFTTFVSVSNSSTGATLLGKGLTNVVCESAKLINVSLQGAGTDKFIGLLPAMRIIQSIDGALMDNSDFVNAASAIVAQTSAVTKAVDAAALALEALEKFTTRTRDTLSSDNTLKRQFRTHSFLRMLNATSDNLKQGIGQSLSQLRSQVGAVLSAEEREKARKVLRKTMSSVANAKDSFVDSIGDFTKTETNPLEPLKMFPTFVVLLFFGAFLVLGCGSGSVGAFFFIEKYSDGTYSRIPHRCACCTWGNGLLIVIPMLILGGILVGLSIPGTALCLLADDIDGKTLKEMAPGLGLNTSGPDMKTAINVIEHCVNPKNKSQNANVLNLIMVTDEETGQETTMMMDIASGEGSKIPIMIEELTAKLTSANPSISTSEGIQEMLRIMKYPIGSHLLVRVNAFSWHTFEDLVSAQITGLHCNDVNGTGLKTWYGEYIAKCGGKDSSSPISTICQTVDKVALDTHTTKCAKGKEYLELVTASKVNAVTFSCPDWQQCDTTTQICSNVTWKDCKFNEVAQEWTAFADRIENTFIAVDTAVSETMTLIAQDMVNLVALYLLLPNQQLLEGFKCGFFGSAWQGLVDGLCYQGVYGIRNIGKGYEVCAIFLFLFSIWMYIVWRYTIDNVNYSELHANDSNEG